jgi:hypothetical protein
VNRIQVLVVVDEGVWMDGWMDGSGVCGGKDVTTVGWVRCGVGAPGDAGRQRGGEQTNSPFGGGYQTNLDRNQNNIYPEQVMSG